MPVERLKQNRDMLMVAGILAMLATIADMFRDTVGFSCSPVYLVHAVGHLAFFCAAFMLGDYLIDRFATARKSEVSGLQQNRAGWFTNLSNIAFSAIPQAYSLGGVVKLGAIIYACWAPLLVLLFPGVIWWDTRQQLLQYNGLPNALSEGAITDHHPVLDTYLYGWFTDLGRALGSVDAGVYAFCLVQAFLTACALACCLVLVRRMSGERGVCLTLLAFLCLYWHLPIYASAMAKDAIFLPFFLLFSVASIEVMRSRGQLLRARGFLLAYVMLVLLVALTRKTGLILALVVLIAVFFRATGRRGKLIVAAVAVGSSLFMAVVMPGTVLPALGCEPGGKQEVYGLMFQQSALLMRDHGDELPEWQRQEIEHAIGEDGKNNYTWFLTDSVKDPTFGRADELDFAAYFGAWVVGLLHHPLCYLEAYLGVQVGWYAMPAAGSEALSPYVTPVDGHNVSHVFPRSRDLGLSWSDATLGRSVESLVAWFQSTPVGMLVGAKALWSTWGMAFLLLEMKRRAPQKLYLLAPLVAANLVLWISPTSYTTESMRYLLPLLFWLPVSAAMVFASVTPTE